MTIAMTRQEWRDRYDTMTTLHSQLAPEQIASVMLDWYGACPDAPECIVTWKFGAFDRSVTFRNGVFVTDIYNGHREYDTVVALVREMMIPDDAMLQTLLDLKYAAATDNNNARWMNSRAICGVLNDVAPNWTDNGDTEGSAVSAIRALAAERDRWSRASKDAKVVELLALKHDVETPFGWVNVYRHGRSIVHSSEASARSDVDPYAIEIAVPLYRVPPPLVGSQGGNERLAHIDVKNRGEGGTAHVPYAGEPLTERAG